jgi:hypothetical protein
MANNFAKKNKKNEGEIKPRGIAGCTQQHLPRNPE